MVQILCINFINQSFNVGIFKLVKNQCQEAENASQVAEKSMFVKRGCATNKAFPCPTPQGFSFLSNARKSCVSRLINVLDVHATP